MSIIPKQVEFTRTVTWTIKNFDLHRGRILCSPKIDVRLLDVTTWSFVLYPKGFTQRDNVQFAVRLHYSGNRDVLELHVFEARFLVHLVDGGGERCFFRQGSFNPTFQLPMSSAMTLFPHEDFVPERHLRDGSLVLVCDLSAMVNQVEFLASIYDDHMVSLSGRLAEMFESRAHSDMVAFSRETVPFDVHACVLKARCPILFSDPPDPVVPTPCGRVWSSDISTPTLKALLFYIYGRTTIHAEDCREELLAVAVRYQLPELERKLRLYANGLEMTTEEVAEAFSMKYTLQELGWTVVDERGTATEARGPLVNASETRTGRSGKLVVSLKATAATEGTEDHLEIAFQFTEFYKMMPVDLKCTLCLLDDGGKVLAKQEFWHTFSDHEAWAPPPFLTWKGHRLLKPHTLRCDALLSGSSLELWKTCSEEKINCILFNNLLLVGYDLLKLYTDRLNCDLKIKVQDHEFLGHKAFLVKRSPTIRMHVEKMGTWPGMLEIKLNRVDGDACGKVMLYMYSGRIDIKDSEEAQKLGKAAAYFGLGLLVEKCFFFKSV